MTERNMIIETGRLVLRQFREEDLQDLFLPENLIRQLTVFSKF